MDFTELSECLMRPLVRIMSGHAGLAEFVKLKDNGKTSKFEEWAHVEVANIFSHDHRVITPEYNIARRRIDLIVDDWVIEMKICPKEIKGNRLGQSVIHKGVKERGVIPDIDKLQSFLNRDGIEFRHGAILFILVRADHNEPEWIPWYQLIVNKIGGEQHLKHRSFLFANGVQGVLYLGDIQLIKGNNN